MSSHSRVALRAAIIDSMTKIYRMDVFIREEKPMQKQHIVNIFDGDSIIVATVSSHFSPSRSDTSRTAPQETISCSFRILISKWVIEESMMHKSMPSNVTVFGSITVRSYFSALFI